MPTKLLRVKPGFSWTEVLARAQAAAPEAFDRGAPRNLLAGEWRAGGKARDVVTPVDGTVLGSAPMLGLEDGRQAVRAAAAEANTWARRPLAHRRERVSAALALLRQHRDTLVALVGWDIGKPWALAAADVDRCIEGVEWYVAEAERLLAGRRPLGLVSNIASWNYPMSVLLHAVLVQTLAGNAVIAKTPTDGGLFSLSVAFALARRAGLPVSLVAGSGGTLSDALVRDPAIAAVAFVGGRGAGTDLAQWLAESGKRYMVEMEGVNTWGVWEYSDWAKLQAFVTKGFEYAKQRCTAYPRFVVQRRLLPQFLDAYTTAVRAVRVGHPFAVAAPGDELPALAFGPLIKASQATELRGLVDDAIAHGAVCLFDRGLADDAFLEGQSRDAYLAPVSLMDLPRASRLYHAEPFGPVDTIVPVDTVEELVHEMNVSNGALVASLATDDAALAKRLAPQLRAFKVGVNAPRSRGDREELFGGLGESWKGCFVGGELLTRAVTQAERGEELPGNFPDHTTLPS